MCDPIIIMDYCNRMRNIQFIIVVTFIAVAHCGLTDEDIILTPKEDSQVLGKTLYFRPLEDLNSEPGVRVPWERALKHLTYVTLYGMPYEKNQLSDDNVNYQKFMNASYIIRTDHIVTNFGDIITLAAGDVEKHADSKYSFIENKFILNKEKGSNKNIIAQWEVQKIRHRDAEKKFRYEIKFSIDPYTSDLNEEGIQGRQLKQTKRVTRSFILRDFDYPHNFIWLDQHVAQRRIDNNRRYLDRLYHFNEVFMQPFYIDKSYYTSDNPNVQNLNIGEFLNEPIQRRVPTFSQYITPTTYRPNYHVKFSKPPLSYEVPIQQNALPIKATHFHHHYFVSENKYENTPRPYNRQNVFGSDNNPSLRQPFGYIAPTPPPIKHQIPTPPNFFNHLSQTPVPIQLTSPLMQPPPSQSIQPQYSTAAPNHNLVNNLAPKVFYNVPQHLAVQQYQFTQRPTSNAQPFLYNFQTTRAPSAHGQEYFEQVNPTQPFNESPREENIRYSEPDPLYKNENVNDQQIVRPEEQIAPKQASRPSDEVRFEGPTQQQPDSEPQWIRPVEENLNSVVNEPSESVTHDFNPEIDVDHRVEISSIVDSNTEQNQISDPNYDNHDNVQMLPPQLENEDESTTLPTETTNEQPPQEYFAEIKPDDKLANASLDVPRLETAVSSVEVTHLGAPVDPPVVTDISVIPISSSSSTSTTTQRSVSAYEAVPTSPYSKGNLLESKDDVQIRKAEAHYKSSSERPVLKWKPKRPRINLPSSKSNGQSDTTYIIAKTTVIQRPIKIASNESSLSIERIPDEDTIQKIFTYHPIAETNKQGISNTTSAPTKRSYSTSVSVKIGTSKEVPYEPTESVPSLELFKAQLEALHTNSSLIKFFKASDRNEKHARGEDEVERAITSSIVKHATSLDN